MADITMCGGGGCSVKGECYRHTAPANPYRQSYFMASPAVAAGSCDQYIQDNRTEEEKRRANENHWS